MGELYKVKYTYSARNDIKGMKEYILNTFKYRELGRNFVQKMKEAERQLRVLPSAYRRTDFQYRGFDIYLKSYKTYLLFYIVDEVHSTLTVLRVFQDGMNWEHILRCWLQEGSKH